MDRRTFLNAATSAGIIAIAGCQHDVDDEQSPTPEETPTPTGTASPTPSPTPADTETATADESKMTEKPVDVSAGDEVSGIVDDVSSGELLVFPSGRFTWRTKAIVTVDDWGIRCQDDTVFEIPAGTGDGEHAKLISTHYGSSTADNFTLENLTFDSPGRAAPGLHLAVRNRAHVDGLQYDMDGPLSNRRHENGIRAYVEDPDGLLRIDDYQQFNNGDLGAYGGSDSRVGIWVGPKNDGTVQLRNPVLQGFPNNGCYVSRQPGAVIVDGGLLMNNNVSAVRVSGGVQVRGTTIYIDVDRYLDGPGALEAPDHNTRGVWGDNREAGTDGGLVTGVSFIIESYRRCTGLATILENPKMTVHDSQFLLDTDIEGIQADDGEIVVLDCDFDGESSGSTAGIGDITGSGGNVAPNIDPGDVPVQSTNSRFDWNRIHPETPGHPLTD